MKTPGRILIEFIGICLFVSGVVPECSASEPTLVRLSFRVPPDRMAEFEAAYEKRVAPVLKRHGLVASARTGRAVVDSVFYRLFEGPSLLDFEGKQQALRTDPAYMEALRELGQRFGTAGGDGLIRHLFTPYSAPVGPGTRVLASDLGRGHWQIYSGVDGLASPRVNAVMQDREGNIWAVALDDGVSRFDGRLWTTYTAKDGVQALDKFGICQDGEGRIWVTGWSGASRFDGRRFTHYTAKDGLSHNTVRKPFLDRDGVMWFATAGGVNRFDGQAWSALTEDDGLVNNGVNAIAQDRAGRIWFGTQAGLSRYDGERFVTFDVKDGLPNRMVTALCVDREDNLWVGTRAGDVSRFDGQSWTPFIVGEGMRHRVNAIFEDRRGRIWIGTLRGVSRYDAQGLMTFPDGHVLNGQQVNGICQDRDGSLWFAAWGRGLIRYDDETLVSFTANEGFPESEAWVNSAMRDRDGNLWFGVRGAGAVRYDGKAFTSFTLADGLPSALPICQDAAGNVWFGFSWSLGQGVVRYDGKTFSFFTTDDGLGEGGVWKAICTDREGHPWFGTIRGLANDESISRRVYRCADRDLHVRSAGGGPGSGVFGETRNPGVDGALAL